MRGRDLVPTLRALVAPLSGMPGARAEEILKAQCGGASREYADASLSLQQVL